MTHYTQKKQHTQNTTTKMPGLNAHTGLRAGEGLSGDEFWKAVLSTNDAGLSGESCSMPLNISQSQPLPFFV